MESETNLSKPKARTVGTSSIKGLDVPFAASEKLPEGVDEETRLFQGIHPDTKERLAVTLQGLKAEFGNELGEKKYLKIAGIAGGSVFFNPNSEATNYRPSLGIVGLSTSLEDLTEQFGAEAAAEKFDVNQKHAAKVAEILASKE